MKRLAGFCILVLLVTLPGRSARADGASLGIGAGVAKTEQIPDTLFLTANLRIPLVSYLVLEPEVGYWKKNYSALGLNASAEDLSFGGNALVVIPARPLAIFGGAGVGAHRLKGTLGVPGLLSASQSETKLGIHLLAGLDVSVAPRLSLFGVGRYDIIHEDSGSDHIHETKFYGGLRLGL
jgi:hypothetical protein